MGDEVLPGLPQLVGMALAGEGEGALDRGAIDLFDRAGGVLLDDREQVLEQRALLLGELLLGLRPRWSARQSGFLGLLRYRLPSSWRAR
jgi:hypothetical protein